jgi:K+-transporting ATPase ATPase C chain
MLQHLRANLMLLILTLLLCSVLYPLALWAIGQFLFHRQAEGSLLEGVDKKLIGSRLIAQAFMGDEYFQPRLSATGGSPYNAMASGASNFAANNPRLRGRVAQQLGPIVRYHTPDGPGKGALVGKDIEKWFQTQNDFTNPERKRGDKRKERDLTAQWAADNPALVPDWATSSDEIKDYLKQWAKDHSAVFAAWKAKNPSTNDDPKPEDIAPFFFDPSIADSFVKLYPGMWPCIIEEEKTGKKAKSVKPDNKGDDVKGIFFEMWLQEHPDTKLEPVPADMVMASGSGLDPHITLKNAHYQLPRVAKKWAEKTGAKEADVRGVIEDVLAKHKEAPFGGLVGVELINVLEVNLEVGDRMKQFGTKRS